MNILFISQDDPFYIMTFFENFLKNYSPLEEIKGVALCSTMGKGKSELAKQLYDFYGTKDFLRLGIRFAKVKFLGFLCQALRLNRFYDLRQMLSFYNIPVIKVTDINGKEFLERLRGYDLDLIISVACPKIFKKDLLRIARHGCINIHTAKLPKYRGMMPNFWNIYNNERETGITIHKIALGIDTGDIILQKDIVIKTGESLDMLIKRTKTMGAHAMIEVLTQFKNCSIQYKKNNLTEGTYFSFPTREDVRKFRKRGNRIF